MHYVKYNVNSKNQLMHNYNYYFHMQYTDNSCVAMILITTGNKECKLHKRQAIIPYQICNGNNANKQLACMAGYKRIHEKYQSL